MLVPSSQCDLHICSRAYDYKHYPCLTNCSPMSFCSDLLVRTKLMAIVTKQKYAHSNFHFLEAEVAIIIHKVTNSIKSHSLEYFLSSLLQLLHTLSKREKECTILNFLANLRESYQACFLEKAERAKQSATLLWRMHLSVGHR